MDSRDVLDPNARTRRAFRGRVTGYYRRVGPNRWDDYQLIKHEQGFIDVMPQVTVELEPVGAVFRIRSRGRVVVVEWVPDADDAEALAGASLQQVRGWFAREFLEDHANAPGLGAAAVIAQKLED